MILLRRKSPCLHHRVNRNIKGSFCLVIQLQRPFHQISTIFRKCCLSFLIQLINLTVLVSGGEKGIKSFHSLCRLVNCLLSMLPICSQCHIGIHGKEIPGRFFCFLVRIFAGCFRFCVSRLLLILRRFFCSDFLFRYIFCLIFRCFPTSADDKCRNQTDQQYFF